MTVASGRKRFQLQPPPGCREGVSFLDTVFSFEIDEYQQFVDRRIAQFSAQAAHGKRFGMEMLTVWQLAADHLEALLAAFRAFQETLNYNDFHWTNLALTHEEPLRAVVFDYDLLGIGPVYCDIRNVLGSLGEPAQGAFREAYGPVDERIAVFDKPL